MVTAGILPFRENSHGRTGYRTRDLMISSQRLWPLDHEAGQFGSKYLTVIGLLVSEHGKECKVQYQTLVKTYFLFAHKRQLNFTCNIIQTSSFYHRHTRLVASNIVRFVIIPDFISRVAKKNTWNRGSKFSFIVTFYYQSFHLQFLIPCVSLNPQLVSAGLCPKSQSNISC